MTYAKKFTNAQRQIAYKQGQKAHGKQVAKQQAQVRKNRSTEGADTSKGKVHFEGDRTKLNKTQRASLDAMEVLAKALGVQIYVESFEGTENANKNGWYDPKDGSIHININAGAGSKGTMLFTVAHELTHFIRQWSPAKFEVLANFLVKQYGEQGVPVSDLIDAQIADAKADNRNLTREEALEEVVADSMESMLSDGSIIEMMAELRQQDRSLWQKICDWFKDLAGKIQAVVDAYKGVQPDSTEGRMVADMKDIIGTLEALYMDALVDASENFDGGVQKITTEDSGGVKYSLMAFDKDGRRFVEIDQDQDRFDGHNADEYPKIAKTIINEKFNGHVIGVDNKMFVNGSGRDEFANPSKHLDSNLYETKMRTAGELDNLLDAGTNFRNEPDGADGHIHPDVIGGFDYFDTLFKIGNKYFSAVINIKNVKRGKLFKDVTKIKDVTQDIMSSYGNNPKSQFLRTSSKDSIRNPNEVVNKKFSMRDKALEHFGRTFSWKETGYLLTNGAKLDFSGRHEGASGGYRTVDHRDILNIYPEDTELDGNGAMVDFMSQGNIRIMPEGNGINLSVKPTKSQEQALDDFISRARGEVTLDIDDDKGNTVVSVEYPCLTRASKVIQDIRNYFETGAEPVVSSLAQFRYSQRDVGRQEAVTQALEKENAKLREDVGELKELVKLQRQVTNGTKFTKTSVEAAARYLKQNAGAKGSTQDLSKLLNELYEYIASTKELTWEGVKEQAQAAADWLWEHIDRRGKRSDYAWENNCHGGSLAAYR